MHIVSHTPNSVLVENNCPLFKTVSQMELPINAIEFTRAHHLWVSGGVLLQDAFYMLNADQREFIKTGLTPEQWASMFGEEE